MPCSPTARTPALAAVAFALLGIQVLAAAPDPPRATAALRIDSLSADPSPGVMVGENISYSIVFVNDGPDAAGNARVTLPTPPNTTFVSASVFDGANWALASAPPVGGTGNVVFENLSSPAPGAYAALRVSVKVKASTPHYTAIDATATASTTDAETTDPNPANNAVSVLNDAMVIPDPEEPNNTFDTATILGFGTTGNLLFSATPTYTRYDNDWYRFEVTPADAGKDLRVNVRITSPYPSPIPDGWRSDLDFDLLDGSHGVRGIAMSGSDDETIYLSDVTAGWYYLNVSYATTNYADSNAWARYAVTIEAGDDLGLGRIAGRVTDGAGAGIENVSVAAYHSPHDWGISFPTVVTDAEGYYSIATLPGPYLLYFTGHGLAANQPTVNVVDEYYADKATLAEASEIQVAAHGVTGGNAALDIGAIVSGQVTSGAGAPLMNVTVGAFDVNAVLRGYTTTDAAGQYRLIGVPLGGAKLRFSLAGFAREFYNDQPTFGPAATLATASGIEIPGRNAVLTPGGAVAGTVKDATGAGRQANVVLYSVLDSTYARATTASIASTGEYAFWNVKPGAYKVFVVPTEGSFGPEWYSDATSFAAATTVTVAEGVIASDRNIVLGTTQGADFNGDLRSDVLWRHQTGGDMWVWAVDGPAHLGDAYVQTVADADWEIRAVADFDGDADPDLLWRNRTTGEIYLWVMQGTSPVAQTYVGTVETVYDIESYGDYSADGKADLLWRHAATGELWAWIMNGPTVELQVYVDTVDPAYRIKASADFNGDGRCDILWHHETAGDVWLWLVQEESRPLPVFVGAVPDLGYQIQAAADFGGDGRADILWRHATQGDIWIWTMDGGVRTAEARVGVVADPAYQIVATGDYNGDLKADLLWWNSVNGDVWVWFMNGGAKAGEALLGIVPDTGYRIVR